MAENIKLGWLEDYDEVKFAPKTFSEQILNADGTSYEVSVQNKIDAINAQISNMQGGTTIVNAANKLNVANTGDTDTPIYFKDGVPIVCTSLDLDTSGNAATATAWKEIRNFSIQDYSCVNTGNSIQVDGSADTILSLPKTIEAETFMGDLNGNAATADKINSSLSINGKTFDGSTAVDVDIIGTIYGGTGNATGRVQIGQEAGEQIGINATSEGNDTIASGNYSHAEGDNTTASGDNSHAEGYTTVAQGDYSHAEGINTVAVGFGGHAEGNGSKTTGNYSHAEGYYSAAYGDASHAEGTETTAIGVSAHSEGSNTTAHGEYSHAEGGSEVTFATLLNKYNQAKNTNFSLDSMSHSNIYNVWKFGQETTDYAALAYNGGHAEGYNNLAIDGHAEGNQTYANLYAHAEGCGTEARGMGSHAEGEGTSAIGIYSHAEGKDTTTYYPYAHAEGTSTRASRDNAHAEGFRSVAEGMSSHAEGSAFARGDYSHAEGKSSFFPIYLTGSDGTYTYSVGSPDLILEPGGIIIVDNLSYNIETVNKESNEISIDFSPSEQWEHKKGLLTYFGALGYCSHVEGDSTKATGSCAHASGLRTEATGQQSWAHGFCTIANGDNQMVIGEYNVADTTSAFIIGNGTSSNHSNAMSVSWTGKVTASKVYGAVWNDYAEYRTQKEIIEPGYCVASADNGQVYKTTEKFQACDGIVSDTFGFAIGETNECKTPLAVAGRVLAYCEGSRYNYHAGDTVCAGPEGKVVKMTREEIREWPDRIIGIVSEIPEYETWGTGNIAVNGRIWIKVK